MGSEFDGREEGAVRDRSTAETVAITPNPLPVDLHEPEGHLLKVSVPARHP